MTVAPQRVGILLDSPALSPQFQRIVEWLEMRGHEAVFIIQNRPALHSPPIAKRALNLFRAAKLRSLAQRLLWRLYEGIERRSAGEALCVLEPSPLPANARVMQTQPTLSRSGMVLRHTDADLERIRALNLSVLLRGGANILRGGILRAAEHGVLSLHHGDNRVNRGGPAAFWEVYKCWPATGYIVQQLTEDLDGGLVLRRGSRPTAARYLANLASIIAGSTNDFIEVLEEILEGRPPEPEGIVPYGGKIFRAPSFLQIAWMLVRIATDRARRIVNRLLARERHWRVGYVQGDWRKISTRLGRDLPELPGHFLADPFVVEHKGRSVVFVEEFGYREAKGKIAAYELGDDGSASRIGTVLEEPFHLSFPFMVEDGGDLFMIPETEEANEVRLYRCVEFPTQWVLDSVLLPAVRALDCIAFKHSGGWWMLVGESTPFATGVRPLLYRAPALRGPWSRCGNRPISEEIEHARNGGLLRHEDALYRVVQLPGFARYGVSTAIHRIDQVSTSAYRETPVTSLRPAHRDDIQGGHHLHHSARWTVFDYWGMKSMRRWPPR